MLPLIKLVAIVLLVTFKPNPEAAEQKAPAAMAQVLAPGATVEDCETLATDVTAKILANNPDVQSIDHTCVEVPQPVQHGA